MCDVAGTAVAVTVFSGRTVHRKTLTAQLDTLRHKFGLAREIQMGDRGLLTSARLREEVRPAGYDRISELLETAIRKLAGHEAIQLSLVD